MQIRRIQADSSSDREAWGRMRLRLFPDLDPAFNDADMEALLSRDQQDVLVAFSGDDAVGFAEVALRNLVDGCLSSPVGYLEGIWVEPEHRGGTGRLLLEAAMEWARRQGCTEFASDSALEDVTAQRWHLKQGFQETFRVVQFRMDL